MNKIINCCILIVVSLVIAACAGPRVGGSGTPDNFREIMSIACTDTSVPGAHDVWDWQNFLIQNKFLTTMSTPDEQYGNSTASATTTFQQTAKVKTTNLGKVDSATYNAALVYKVNNAPLTNTTPITQNCSN